MSQRSAPRYFHYLERAVEQRKRAGALTGTDELHQAKRDFLLTMALRNERQAELHMREDAGQPLGPAKKELRKLDTQLVAIRDRLARLGVNVRRKK